MPRYSYPSGHFKHKHIYQKVSQETEESDNMFQFLANVDLGKMEDIVTRYKCNCGDKQEFHHATFENPDMPKTITINDTRGKRRVKDVSIDKH